MKSLKASGHPFSISTLQLEHLHAHRSDQFADRMADAGLHPLKPTRIEIFQINVGKMCNQTCKHCHVDAGPDRKEIMTRETLQRCLDILATHDIPTIDITGGAPEMNPHFRWFVEEAARLGKHIIDRCNLTILLANPKYYDLPQFLAKHRVEVVSSLPHYTAVRTDRQRGDGVFEKSIQAMRMLNEAGYGQEGTGLELNLVYNPTGAILPGPQQELEADFKRHLLSEHGVYFNKLYVITNMPISRFLDFLVVSGNYETYMQKLIDAFNPSAAMGVMCRNTLSIGWDGTLYDCDFSQMLDIKIQDAPVHIDHFDLDALTNRSIVVDQHCYGCTAGLGSSCGGQVV